MVVERDFAKIKLTLSILLDGYSFILSIIILREITQCIQNLQE